MTAFHLSATGVLSSVDTIDPALDRVSESVVCDWPLPGAPGDTSVPLETLKPSSVVVGERPMLNRSPLTAATTFSAVVCDASRKFDVVCRTVSAVPDTQGLARGVVTKLMPGASVSIRRQLTFSGAAPVICTNARSIPP